MQTTTAPNINSEDEALRSFPGPTFEEAASLLDRLVEKPPFLELRFLPLLRRVVRAEDWYVAYRHDATEGSCSLQVFVGPPGSRTKIHDHSSWGAFRCVAGSILEERHERLDDGSQKRRARLRKLREQEWGS